MTAVTNYGSTYTFNGATIGKCQIVTAPSIEMGDAETTNHNSGGYAESIPDGLIRLGDMTLRILNETGVLSNIKNIIANKTVANSVVTNGIDTLTVSSWIKSAVPNEADATDPEANWVEVVVACTGPLTVA